MDPHKTSICTIFDLDGTLVDSEPLNTQAFFDLLPFLDRNDLSFIDKYRGQKLADIVSDIENRHAIALPDDFEEKYRKRVAELFDTDLRAVPGAIEMLKATDYRRSIASSAPQSKIRHALEVCGLSSYFKDIFSSYDIGSWKPEPDLFLHAAGSMGFAPNRCVIIDDSDIGIMAAEAAGMLAVQYKPHSTTLPDHYPIIIRDMSELPTLLKKLASGK
jgi:HAD superfamily hydrolase (TIGR01509 family)